MIGVVIGCVVVLCAAILLVNALRVKPTGADVPLPPSTARGDDESVRRFQEMLRLPTVWGRENPDADHAPFDAFVPKLRELYPLVFQTLECTMVESYGILLEWKGADPQAQPIVLMAHHDVVEANPEGWTHDPFAASIEDGRIWARGALDTKCLLAGLLEATESLLNDGFVPPRTIYLWSSNCEEDNGDTTPALVKMFREKRIDPLFVLDEGGAIVDNAPLGVRNQMAMVGVSEKGLFNAFVAVNSEGGHASTPSRDDATAKLVSGLDKLQKTPPPSRISRPLEAMLRELAAYSGFGMRIVFGNMWLFRPLVKKILESNHETAAMVRTTYALTELAGSPTANVIPKQAKATINVRIDPAENIQIAQDRIKACFDADAAVSLRDAIDPSPLSPFDDDVFGYLRAVIQSVYPDTGVAPYVQSSCTDSRHFAREYPRVYRFAGFLFKGDQRSRIHGQDENIDVESFKQGVGFYIELIRNLDRLEDRG